MLAETFSYVENEVIMESGILRGTLYRDKKYGKLSPNSRYIQDGLYPEIGKIPLSFNPQTDTISDPIFTFNKLSSCVDVHWIINPKTPQELQEEINEIQRAEDATQARIELKKPYTIPSTQEDSLIDLRKRVKLIEKIILVNK